MQVKMPQKAHPAYRAFTDMRTRCNNPKNKAYRYYGGRGITVCDEWAKFEAFRDWAEASGYVPGLTLDRIDTDGNYEPNNCRWATRSTQVRNRNPFRNGTSKYIGVSWNTEKSKWDAKVCINYKLTHLGRFDDEKSAAKARDTYLLANGLTEYTLNF